MPIRNRLRELRTDAGKTQQQVVDEIADLMGGPVFRRPMLSLMEQGQREVAGEVLDALCRYYRVQPGEILVWEPGGRPGREGAVAATAAPSVSGA